MKHLFLSTIALITLFSATSCLDEGTGTSTAKTSYLAICDSVVFDNSENEVFEPLITATLDSLAYTGSKSAFQEEATVDVSFLGAARSKCHEQAVETYNTKIKGITLDVIKSGVFIQAKDSFQNIGYTSAADIPLSDFIIYLDLLYIPSSPAEGIQPFTLKLFPKAL